MPNTCVTVEYELEREGHNGKSYHGFELVVRACLQYSRATFDDPGERRVELDSVTCGGEPFELTDKETEALEQYIADTYEPDCDE